MQRNKSIIQNLIKDCWGPHSSQLLHHFISETEKKREVLFELTHLDVLDSKHHRISQVNLIAELFIYCCRDDRGVDNDRVIGRHRFCPQLHAGILRGEIGAQVVVQHKSHPDLT